ncbi:MAG: DUF4912 domain-containing protein [Leptolyngbyaceae cyanobacterium SM1_1_3]|nr:DUF4912 domain-containing protein [Leptolyngbyaceae cyanobacterium SM1_1_3]NJN03760.1 DUF4912 domain-containing protein [Leptolyngbyaceae cyanobacterium RM1_1_2]NJO08521.1 DUF4912 domain-containing protein [Leptolyngbyaceae cyanobacterium SL_1_1]
MTQSRPPLEEMTLRQLRRVASECEVSRYSRMRKVELIAAIQAVQARRTMSSPLPMATEGQAEVEAAKFDRVVEESAPVALATVDQELPDLPSGYGESRIVLMPRDPQWAYVYWDIPNEHKEELRRQGGSRLALRFYDVTNIKFENQSPHSLQQYECDELAREWYVPVPVSDRDYISEIGYVCNDGRWLVLARSIPVRVPPVYPSDWVEDQFITVGWNEDLRGKTFVNLAPPSKRMGALNGSPLQDSVFTMTKPAEAQRVAGSLFGSMQHAPGSVFGSMQMAAPEQAVSSYVFPSGVGMWAGATASGAGLTASGMGMGATMSGVGMGLMMSGMGMNMSGAGFSASAPPIRPRQFWLVADAELIVYGATEPDASVTVGGQPIKLNPDGTFRFQMSFQDGLIDYPILAVAADGDQTRSVHMKFNRETPSRHTNTKAEAVQEWLS